MAKASSFAIPLVLDQVNESLDTPYERKGFLQAGWKEVKSSFI